MRLINVDELWTDITSEIEDCNDVLEIIERQTIIVTPEELICSVNVNMDTDEVLERLKERGWEPVEHGRWIKMSDADGVYYACSECGEELTRIEKFDPQFDLFPRLKSIDKTHFCPNCGARMMEGVSE